MTLFGGLDWVPANDNVAQRSHCPECGRPSKKIIKTTCRACYQKKRAERMPPSTCHPEKKEHAGGLCRDCYRAGYRAPKATCRPDRRHAAFGLCQDCYNNLPETKERNIRKRRLRKYGLSEEQYDELMRRQEFKCAICGSTPTAVDHDHSTGAVRGLLCHACNSGLGQFRDSPTLMRAAAVYIEETKSRAA